MKGVKLSVLLVLSFFSNTVIAGVNLKNGNFYISYTDAVVTGTGQKLEMTRTYNSKSTTVGWFGFGWGNYFETKLVPSADGCVVVHEHGAGGKTRFCPKTQVDPKAASKKIVEAMRKNTTMTETAAKNLINRLVNNAELRHEYAKNFNVKTKLAKGTKLFSNLRGIQEIAVTGNGYLRKSNDGRVEEFNNLGQLKKITDKNKNSTSFKYQKGKLYSLSDNFGKQIYFDWYSNGRVKSMWTNGDKKALFKYNGNDLVYSKDLDGKEYAYSYDKNHNLTKITYNPSRKKGEKEDAMKMEYESSTYFISKITDRNGNETKYKYGANSKKPDDHYWTEVIKPGFDGKLVKNKYEYEIKTKADGSRYTYRIATTVNNVKTETIYSECCGLPLKISRGKHVTNFEYDDGLLVKKSSTKGELVKIEYDKKHKKISKVTNNGKWTAFQYDPKGNLVQATNGEGKKVLLIYDRNGKITKMLDKDSKTKKTRQLDFEYNSIGKPVVISMKNVGKINVLYDNYGDIKRVDSKSGHKMAIQVTQAFQNLLQIVKPAGVNLNM